LQHELACDRICDDISHLLFELRAPTTGDAYAAAIATRNVAAAMHRASGRPHDPLWSQAMTSLDRFLDACAPHSIARTSSAFRELRGFLIENADLLGPHVRHQQAS
jgi:hypothetical protein